jgi:hypothetical protein
MCGFLSSKLVEVKKRRERKIRRGVGDWQVGSEVITGKRRGTRKD